MENAAKQIEVIKDMNTFLMKNTGSQAKTYMQGPSMLPMMRILMPA